MALLAATGISKSYGDLKVLQGLNLHLERGEGVAIVGTSGTGKSTLLHILGLMEHPDAGTLSFDNVDVHGLGRQARARVRARACGFIFQAFHLLSDFTVEENILMAARAAGADLPAMRQRVKTLLEQVGLGSRAKSRVQVLSGGERQRIAICRALLLKPDLILADEPTGNLDPATAKTILDLIETLCAQSALLIVTHDPMVAARMKRTLRLKEGILHPEGAHHG